MRDIVNSNSSDYASAIAKKIKPIEKSLSRLYKELDSD